MTRVRVPDGHLRAAASIRGGRWSGRHCAAVHIGGSPGWHAAWDITEQMLLQQVAPASALVWRSSDRTASGRPGIGCRIHALAAEPGNRNGGFTAVRRPQDSQRALNRPKT